MLTLCGALWGSIDLSKMISHCLIWMIRCKRLQARHSIGPAPMLPPWTTTMGP